MACKEGTAYASAFPMNSKPFLKLSGYFSLFFGLLFSGVALMVGVFFWLGLREVDSTSPEAVDVA